VLDNNTPQEQDHDDGLLFFHSHSIWEALFKLEKFYKCKIYGVLELQEVESNLMSESSYSKQEMLDAIEYAYDKVDASWEYELYLDTINEYLTANKQGGQDAN
tara:strand:+ start:405 stop:713 length:309 start_codon:yes stop_codon:yes gene_type:complete